MPSSGTHSSATTNSTFSLLECSRFHARACLLAVLSKQQDPSSLNGNTEEMNARSNDDESDDDGSDADTVVPRELVKAAGKAKLKESFLDRLAEMLSREKPQQGEKNKHVAATALVEEEEDEATIYVAKNGGFDKTDSSALHRVGIWMRAIAADGRRPLITKDAMWKKLVEYYQKRLEFNVQGLAQGLESYLTMTDTAHATKKRLCRLAELLSHPMATGTEWHEIIYTAYELRYDKSTKSDLNETAGSASEKLWQRIMLLGRLRVAYETFIEAAMHLAVFKKVKIVENNVGLNEEVAGQLSRKLPPRVSTQFERLTSRQRKAFKKRLTLPCFVHAEIQLLMQLERLPRKDSNAVRVFNYIGCSKRTCYLCCKLIQEHGSFRTRGTHGKVYDQWTVPALTDISIASTFRFKVALHNIELDMITRYEKSLGSQRLPLVPESSVGVSEHSAASIFRHRLRQLGLDTEVLKVPDSNGRKKEPPVTKLGKRRTSFQAARIPADSNHPMELVRLVTHEIWRDYPCEDLAMGHVPDFARFWGENYNFDRAMYRFGANNQEVRSLDGDYRIHWNVNDELPENETLEKLIGLVDVPSHRRFWYGDVFIERIGKKNGYDFDEHGNHLYDDIPPEFLDSQLIALIFRDSWNSEALEDCLKEATYLQDESEKIARDREIFMQRM